MNKTAIKLISLAALSLIALFPYGVRAQQIPSPIKGDLLPTGQAISPAGRNLSFGGKPIDLALSPNHQFIYAKDNWGVVAIDTKSWTLLQALSFPGGGGGSLHGIVLSQDGLRLWATDAGNDIHEAAVSPDGPLTWTRRISLPGPKGSNDPSYPCGIALSPDGKSAYVCLSLNNTLGVVDLASGAVTAQVPVGVAPWGVVISPDGKTAYVSDWGGRRARRGERTAPSAGTDTLVDNRGVADSGMVSIVDLTVNKEVAAVKTGLHPCDMRLSADGGILYVANSNSDSVSVIDTQSHHVVQTIPLRLAYAPLVGSAPTGLDLSADGRTLYVTDGGDNALAVIAVNPERIAGCSVQGYIPVGWYPGGVVTDGANIYIANVKGDGHENRPKEAKGYNSYQYLGSVEQVLAPSTAGLRGYTRTALADDRLPPDSVLDQTPRANVKPVPVPERLGEPSVFKHVVYIIKENRTYDQVLGDIGKGNSDPTLCIYGKNVTPNHHALADQFVLLDNYYCNGVVSADGHCWATEGSVADYLEKSFGGFTRSYTWGDDPLAYSPTGFIWDDVIEHGRTFINYGEMDYASPVPDSSFKDVYRDYRDKTGKYGFHHSIGISRLRTLTDPIFPGWNLGVPDILRADMFTKSLQHCEQEGQLPGMVMVYIGDDHTAGTSPGYPTPRAEVADNDLALGRIIESISKSRFWATTCIFVIEDDPQDGFDHVDGYRSLCLVISPYTRRRGVVSHFYNQTSVLHTMEQILGIPPMNQFDSLAPLMTGCFTVKPDFRPYICQQNRIAVDEMNPTVSSLSGPARWSAKESAAMDFAEPDRINDDTLNRILWHAAMGQQAAYPARMAGPRPGRWGPQPAAKPDDDDDDGDSQ